MLQFPKKYIKIFLIPLLLFAITYISNNNVETVKSAVCTHTWTAASDGNWSTVTNWNTGTAPSTTSHVACFDGSTGTNTNVTIDTTLNLKGIQLQNGYSGTITANNEIDVTLNETLTITSGTFIAGNGTYSLTGNHNNEYFTINGGTADFSNVTSLNSEPKFTLSSGSFTAPSTTFALGGAGAAMKVTGGTFNANGGTLLFDYQFGNPQLDTDLDLSLHNVSLDLAASGWGLSLTNSTDGSEQVVTIGGNLNLITGKLNGTVHTVNLQGNLSSTDTGTGNTQALNLTGTNTQTITLNAVDVADFDADITINKASGSVKLGADLTLNASNQDLTLTAGTLDLAGYDLIVNGSGGTYTAASGTNIRLEGDESSSTTEPSLSTNTTVTYYGTSSGKNAQAWDYHHLIIDGAGGVFTLNGTANVAGNLTISNGTLALNGNGLTVTGTVSNNDTLRLIGNESVTFTNDTDSGTIEYVGDGDGASDTYGIQDLTYYNLVFNSTDTGVNTDIFTPTSADTLTNSLDSYWNFDETSGTTAADSGSNGYDGTHVSSPTISEDVPSVNFSNPRSLNFSRASSQYVNIGTSAPNLDFNSEDFSLFTWVKPNAANAGTIIDNRYDISGNDEGWIFGLGNNDSGNLNLIFDVNDGGAGDNITRTSTGTYTAAEWNHIGFVKSGTTITFYVNGSSAGTATVPSSVGYDATVQQHSIGFATISYAGNITYDIPAKYFDGSIDDLRIYSRTLTSAEISALANGNNTTSSDINSLDINGNLTITSGSFTTPTTLTIGGNMTLADGATFTHNDGTVTLDGTTQTLSGDITFYNLTKTTASATTLTLTAGDTITVENTTTLQGASGNLLSIVSSSGGTQASLDPQGTRNFQYLNVTDINNTNATTILCLTGCVDGTGNTNWTFSLEIAFSSTTGSNAETSTTINIPVQLGGTYGSDLTVDYTVTGTATGGGVDYTLANGTATITAGQTSTNIELVLVSDQIDETDETVIITLSNPSNPATLGNNTVHTFTITDNDTAGVTITESGGSLAMTEGLTDTYTVVLTSKPTASVTITLADDDDTSVDSNTLTFTTVNWNSAQTVTVTAVDDSIAEGEHTGTITHSASSDDANYVITSASITDATATITDNDTAGVTITEVGGTTAATEGGTDTYQVVLTSQPTHTVTITITDNDDVTSDQATLTFATNTWDQTQTVTLTAVDDNITEGEHTSTVTHTGSSTDTNYNNIAISNVTMTITDNDTAGVTITEALSMTEGATDTYTITLTSEPTSTVTITLTTDDDTSVDSNTVTIAPAAWNTGATVTVTAVDDSIAEGEHTGTITHSASSDDANYVITSASITNATATITDNDTAGVTITEALAMTEGATDTYTIVLTSEPTASVTITLADDDDTSVDSNTLTFTTVNWNSAQTVTVTATDDSIAEGEHTGTITHSASSDDANYVITSASITNATATITDNDTAGITVTESDSTTAATEGGTDTYEVVLDSQPTNDVVITITADAQSSVDPATLTFTSADWNTAQTVTITATDDSAVESSHTSTISHTVASDDSNYNAFSISDITLSITDNDEEAAGGGSISILLNNLNQTNTNSGDSTSGDNTSSDSGDTGSTTTTFTDIANHWAQEFIETLYEMEVVDGRTEETFEPNDTITRAELTKIAINIFEYELSTSTVPFSDVTLDHWGYQYIATAYENGFIEGYDNNTFKPDTEINRVEALKILLAAGQVEFDETEIDTVELFFVDIKEDAWYMPYLKYGVLKEIIDAVQTRNEVRPGANITRAEAAKIAVLIHDLL